MLKVRPTPSPGTMHSRMNGLRTAMNNPKNLHENSGGDLKIMGIDPKDSKATSFYAPGMKGGSMGQLKLQSPNGKTSKSNMSNYIQTHNRFNIRPRTQQYYFWIK